MTRDARAAQMTAAVQRIDAAAADDRSVREQIVSAVRQFVPFDFHAFVLTDPVSTVGCSPLADVPDVARLPTLIRLKYLTDINRWTDLPSGGATLLGTTAGRPERSLVWREHLAALGVVDVYSAAYTDRFGCWGFLDLWRSAPFENEDVAMMARVAPRITALLREAQMSAFVLVGAPMQRGGGASALVMSPDLEVRAHTPQSREWMAALLPRESGQSIVPASAYNVAAQLLATEAGVDTHAPQARVHLGGGEWLALRAARWSGPTPPDERDVVVTVEPISSAERRDLISRVHALTAREDELLTRLAEGIDTRSAAREMAISEHTVQDHLKSVFRKTSTSSRRELLAMASGH